MNDLKTIRKRAARMVAASNGPLGRLPVERTIRANIEFFVELRATGASWSQIAELLRQVGVCTRRGLPISESVLRATYARACRGAQSERDLDLTPSRPVHAAAHFDIEHVDDISTNPNLLTVDAEITARMNRALALRQTRKGA